MAGGDGGVVIVGGGQAAGALATALRSNGFQERVLILCDEPHVPYQRPPLSKAYLSGEAPVEKLHFRPPAALAESGIEVRTGTRVTAIDRAARRVTLAGGEAVSYGQLALATGSRPRRLAAPDAVRFHDAPNVHYLRRIADADRIRERFRPGARLALIGGGYIGLEIAATARGHGLEVTLLEAQPRVLARVTAPGVSAFYERAHRDAGVDLRTGVTLEGFDFAADGCVTAVRCRGSAPVGADLVVAGIGIEPNVELARDAGLGVDNGISVDASCRTSDPHILAAGDCANQPSAFTGGRLRLESVPNALEQGRCAAATLTGRRHVASPVPWFWSDQYDLKLQMAGLSQGHDRVLLRGSPEARSFIAFYLKEERIIAADAVNRGAEFGAARKLVGERAQVPRGVDDDARPLAALLQRA